MRTFVFMCSALLVFAAALELLSSGYQPDVLLNTLLAQPLPQRIAWLVIIIAPFALIAAALLQNERLIQQRKTTDILETRLGGVRRQAAELEEPQKDLNAGADYLARTDPEDAISSLQRRLIEAERTVQLQQSRDKQGDLPSRLESLRQQQLALRETLGSALEKRRSIEPLVSDLRRSQDDMERTLLDIEGEGLQARLQDMTESSQHIGSKCEEIERILAAFMQLKNELVALQSRLAPLEDNQVGVKNVVGATHDIRDRLMAGIKGLDQDEGGSLAERVGKLSETRQELTSRVAELIEQFSKLDAARRDVGGLFSQLSHRLEAHLVSWKSTTQ